MVELLTSKTGVKNSCEGVDFQKMLKWLWLATIATAFFGPLLAMSAFPNIFAYKILFILHLILLGILLICQKVNFCISAPIKPYFRFFAVWMGWALLSLLWCDNRIDGAVNIYYLFSGISLMFFTALYFRTEKDMRMLLSVLIFIFLAISAVGIWEYTTGQHLKTAGYIFDAKIYSKIPRGVFKNPNDLATYLVLYWPLLYVTARYCLARIVTAPLALIPAGLMGMGVFLIINTGSRANMLALALVGTAAVAVYLVQGKWKAFRNITVVLTVLLLLYYSLAATYPKVQNWSNRLYRIARHHLVSLEYVGGQSSARMVLLKNGLHELNRHCLMGVGAGNAEEHMKKYRTENFLLLALHNWWLEVLVNYGVFIFVLYLAFYGKLLYDLYTVTVRAGPGPVKLVAESALLALVGFPVAAFSSSSLMYSRFMWILFGLALCAVNLYYGLPRLEKGDGQ